MSERDHSPVRISKPFSLRDLFVKACGEEAISDIEKSSRDFDWPSLQMKFRNSLPDEINVEQATEKHVYQFFLQRFVFKKKLTPFEELINKVCSNGFTDIVYYDPLMGPIHMNWNIWEGRFRAWLNDNNILWQSVQYADLLGFFINWSLKNHYGSFEVQLLLTYVTSHRNMGYHREIEAIFTRLNELKLFDEVRPLRAQKFAKNLAIRTQYCVSWTSNFPDSLHFVCHDLYDDLDSELNSLDNANLDPKFVLRVPEE